MKIFGDYHTHTKYSHGKGTIRDNVLAAREQGLRQIAITDHGFEHIAMRMTRRKIDRMRQEIAEISQDYDDIDIYLGVEANLLGLSGRIDIPKDIMEELDVVLFGFHREAFPDKLSDYMMFFQSISYRLQGRKAINRYTNAYLNAIDNNPVDIITHMNKVVRVDCKAVAQAAKRAGTFIEFSSRYELFDRQDMQDIIDSGVGIIINSDAHEPDMIGKVDCVYDAIKRYNIPEEQIVNLGTKRPKFRSQRG